MSYNNLFENNLQQFIEALKSVNVLNEDFEVTFDMDMVKDYIEKLSNYETDLVNKDFKQLDSLKVLNDKLDLIDIINSEKLTDQDRDVTWRYIQTLYVCGKIAISTESNFAFDSKKFISKVNETRSQLELFEEQVDIEGMKSRSRDEKSRVEDMLGKVKSEDIRIDPDKVNESLNNVRGMFQNTIADESKESNVLMELMGDLTESIGDMMKNQSFNPQKLLKGIMSGNMDEAGIDIEGLMNKMSDKLEERTKSEGMTEDDLNNQAEKILKKLMSNDKFKENPMIKSLLGENSDISSLLNSGMLSNMMGMLDTKESVEDIEREVDEMFGNKDNKEKTEKDKQRELRMKLRQNIRNKRNKRV